MAGRYEIFLDIFFMLFARGMIGGVADLICKAVILWNLRNRGAFDRQIGEVLKLRADALKLPKP